MEDAWTQVPSAVPTPLILGPAGGRAVDDDLWRIVSEPRGAQQSLASSFDSAFDSSAFDSVDANLEALVSFTALAAPISDEPSRPSWRPRSSSRPALPFEVTTPSNRGTLRRWTTPGIWTPGVSTRTTWRGIRTILEDAARMRRQRLLRRAMENMGTLGRARRTPRRRRPRDPGRPRATPPPGPAAAARATPPPSADEGRLAAQIEQRHAALQNGPATTSPCWACAPRRTREQVKAAFLALAKVFHPDRLPPSLLGLAPKMTSVFEAIREAYEILYDDASAAYLASAKKPQAQGAAATPGTSPTRPRLRWASTRDLFKMARSSSQAGLRRRGEDLRPRLRSWTPSRSTSRPRPGPLYMDPARKAEVPGQADDGGRRQGRPHV